MRWTKVEANEKLYDMAKNGTKKVEEKNRVAVDRSKLNWPGTWGHTCNSVMNGRLSYVFGGFIGNGCQTNDVYVFDTTKQTWNKPEMKGTAPCPRDSHSCTAVENKLYVFGGCDGTNPLKDLYILDTDTNCWTSPITEGDSPAPREGHSSARIGSRVFIFGGCGRTPDGQMDAYFNDMYILCTVTLTWTKVTCSGTPPSPRDGHTCSAYRNNLIVIGGEDSSFSYADTHILDVSTLVWSEFKTHGELLTPRAGHLTVALGKFLVIFGGYCKDPEHTLFEDLHVLTFESGLWTKETPIATNGESPSPRFALAGDSAGELHKGVIFFVGGCNKKLEALGDMYCLDTLSQLHTKKLKIQPDHSTLHSATQVKVSMKKELKRKQQEMQLRSKIRKQGDRVDESPQPPKISKSLDPEKYKTFSSHGIKAAKGNSKGGLSTTEDRKCDGASKCKSNRKAESLWDRNTKPRASLDARLSVGTVKRGKNLTTKNHRPVLPAPESQDTNVDASVRDQLDGNIQQAALSNSHMRSGAHVRSPAQDIETKLCNRVPDIELRESQPLSLLPHIASTAESQEIRAGVSPVHNIETRLFSPVPDIELHESQPVSLLSQTTSTAEGQDIRAGDSTFTLFHEPTFYNLSLGLNDEPQENVGHDGAKLMKRQELQQNLEKDCSFGALGMYDNLNVLIDLNNSPKSPSTNFEYSFESHHQLLGVPFVCTEILRNSEHQQLLLSAATKDNERAKGIVAQDLQAFRSLNSLPKPCLEFHQDNDSAMRGNHELKRLPALEKNCPNDSLRVFQDLNEVPLGTDGCSLNNMDMVTRREFETEPPQELLLTGADEDPSCTCDNHPCNSSNLLVLQDLNHTPMLEMQSHCARENCLVTRYKGNADEKCQLSIQQVPLVTPLHEEQDNFLAPDLNCAQQDSDKQLAPRYEQHEQIGAQGSGPIQQLLVQVSFQSKQKIAQKSNPQKLMITVEDKDLVKHWARECKQQECLASSESRQQEQVVQTVATEGKQQGLMPLSQSRQQEYLVQSVSTESKQLEYLALSESSQQEQLMQSAATESKQQQEQLVKGCEEHDQQVHLAETGCKQREHLVATEPGEHAGKIVAPEWNWQEQFVTPENKQQEQLVTPEYTMHTRLAMSGCKDQEQLVALECNQQAQEMMPKCKQQAQVMMPKCKQQAQSVMPKCKQQAQTMIPKCKQGHSVSPGAPSDRTTGTGLDEYHTIHMDEDSNVSIVATDGDADYDSFDHTYSSSTNHVEKSFEAKVTGVFHYGFNVESNIDQNLLRGLLFSFSPAHADAVQARLNSGRSIIFPTVPHGCSKRTKKKRSTY